MIFDLLSRAIRGVISPNVYRCSFYDRWNMVKGHPSGFDYMRIGLAVAVLMWHSYQITYGTLPALIYWGTPAGLVLQLILPAFFCLSGFLVSGSLERNRDLRTFLTLRLIRIYPALCVEVVLSAFVLGPLVTSYSLSDYLKGPSLHSYLANMIGWIHYTLPGVFLSQPFPEIVNTSIWTVPFELECYIVLPILVLIGFLRSRRTSMTMFVACSVIVFFWLRFENEGGSPPGGIHGRVLVLCFLAGSVIFQWRKLLPYSAAFAVPALILSMFLLRHGKLVLLAPLFIAYATAYFGMKNPRRTFIVSSGDYSYGTYLYAAPIQQTVVWAIGTANNWATNVLLALPITIVFALFSWHFVEKPFLQVKRYVLARPKRTAENESEKS